MAEDIVDAVGVFTKNLNDLDLLYYSGIPVWYVRNTSQIPNQCIDKVMEFIKEDSYWKITLHWGEILDCSDASPAHQVVYTGLAANSQ
ncbi:hypothetical protein GYMLUDRAFT_174647 [Collybiopsis luxurians FD-317 M1]|uniref:Uncharacterized protein n=1 Tax=Collybiopsis luxurians FD-317 M1 TaxID=944289 RepID=A0A0D0CDH6_9AGAR|nr:hypothetical protein GYMLUDRAFT_174647 [Collybiopsis luxurians FD-317 M1]